MRERGREREQERERERFCVTHKSKNQIQMVDVNKEVDFDSDYLRHFWFNNLAEHSLLFESRQYVIRRGAESEGHASIICKLALEGP